MARRPALSIDSLIGLGAPRLAELALEEAGSNRAFKKRLDAALAAAEGPHAGSAIVDKRLAALERAKGAIGSGRIRAFVEDLSATLKIIAGDLANIDADGAAERLIRLLATADRTFSRSVDADAAIAGVFRAAAAALPALIGRLKAGEAAPLADGLYALAADSRSAVVHASMAEILAASPKGLVATLDARLARAIKTLASNGSADADWSLRARER